jgi:hypothetical protein
VGADDSAHYRVRPEEEEMFTNDIKKGAQVQLSSGKFAVLMDNRRGTVRQMKVYASEYGMVHEQLSQNEGVMDVYSHTIVAYRPVGEKRNWYTNIELTPDQKKIMLLRKALADVI